MILVGRAFYSKVLARKAKVSAVTLRSLGREALTHPLCRIRYHQSLFISGAFYFQFRVLFFHCPDRQSLL
jgi:hypothetical protein